MTKEQQNLSWACLPKEAREKMKKDIAHPFDGEYYKGWHTALTNYFGHHNLTSDTEPDEMLIKSRAKVIDLYTRAENEVSFGSEDLQLWGKHCIEILDSLFGDKCLPDKELNEDNFAKSEPSVQGEPKFKYNIDDKVILKGSDKPMLIRQRVGFKDYDNGCQIATLDTRYPQWVKESDLEPYTEPESGNNEEKQGNNLEIHNLSQNSAENCDNGNLNSTCDNMEEKEFGKEVNFPTKELSNDKDFKMGDDVYLGTELLGKFICYSYSEYYKEIMVEVLVDSGKDREVNQGGWFAKDVSKTPQKPKRWRAKYGEEYVFIDTDGFLWRAKEGKSFFDDKRHKCGNYFKDDETAQQAAEAVREALQRFHEQNQK